MAILAECHGYELYRPISTKQGAQKWNAANFLACTRDRHRHRVYWPIMTSQEQFEPDLLWKAQIRDGAHEVSRTSSFLKSCSLRVFSEKTYFQKIIKSLWYSTFPLEHYLVWPRLVELDVWTKTPGCNPYCWSVHVIADEPPPSRHHQV